jgi:hypothetical protein
MILERADAIGKMFHKDLEIASFVGFGYEEGVRSSTIPYQGGSGVSVGVVLLIVFATVDNHPHNMCTNTN